MYSTAIALPLPLPHHKTDLHRVRLPVHMYRWIRQEAIRRRADVNRIIHAALEGYRWGAPTPPSYPVEAPVSTNQIDVRLPKHLTARLTQVRNLYPNFRAAHYIKQALGSSLPAVAVWEGYDKVAAQAKHRASTRVARRPIGGFERPAKSVILRVLVAEEHKAALIEHAARTKSTPSEVVRTMLEDAANGVESQDPTALPLCSEHPVAAPGTEDRPVQVMVRVPVDLMRRTQTICAGLLWRVGPYTRTVLVEYLHRASGGEPSVPETRPTMHPHPAPTPDAEEKERCGESEPDAPTPHAPPLAALAYTMAADD
jgi:hypothetical protein